jgi:hypothetical protein
MPALRIPAKTLLARNRSHEPARRRCFGFQLLPFCESQSPTPTLLLAGDRSHDRFTCGSSFSHQFWFHSHLSEIPTPVVLRVVLANKALATVELHSCLLGDTFPSFLRVSLHRRHPQRKGFSFHIFRCRVNELTDPCGSALLFSVTLPRHYERSGPLCRCCTSRQGS